MRYTLAMLRLTTLLIVACITQASCIGIPESTSALGSIDYIEGESLPAPKTGNGLVIFYGHNQGQVGTYIYDADDRIAAIAPGAYTYIDASPGQHIYTSKLSGEASVTFPVESGQTYYVHYWFGQGELGPHPNLELVPKETGQAAVPGLKYARMKPQD